MTINQNSKLFPNKRPTGHFINHLVDCRKKAAINALKPSILKHEKMAKKEA